MLAVFYFRIANRDVQADAHRTFVATSPARLSRWRRGGGVAVLPGMRNSGEFKRRLSERLLEAYNNSFDVINMSQHALRIRNNSRSLKTKPFES